MEATAVLRSLEALLPADPEVAEGFLLASVYCVSMAQGRAPRDVLETLWKSLPASDAWPGLRDSLLTVLGDSGPGEEP